MRFLNKVEYYLPFYLPFLLIFSRTIADFTVVLISLLFLYKSYFDNNFEWSKSIFFKIIIIFFIYLITINSYVSSDSTDTLIYSLSFIRWPIFAMAITYWIFKEEKAFKKLLGSIMICLIFFLVHIWYQYLSGSPGNFGFFINNHPNRLLVPFTNNPIAGRFLIFYSFLLLTLYFLIKKINKGEISFFIVLVILLIGLFSTFITGERMSFLIYLSSSLFIMCGAIIENKKYFYLSLSLIIFASLIFALFFNNDPDKFNRIIFSSYQSIKNFSESDYGMVFNTSFEKWKNNYLFGGGLHQFKSIQPIYGYGIGENSLIYHAHNLPLNLLVETGLFGLILFYSFILLILIPIIKRIIHSKNKKNFLLFCSLLNLLYVCFFPLHTHFKLSHNWINATTWLIIGLIFAMINIYEKNIKNK